MPFFQYLSIKSVFSLFSSYKPIMLKTISNKILITSIIIIFGLNSCAKEGFFKPGDARKAHLIQEKELKKI